MKNLEKIVFTSIWNWIVLLKSSKRNAEMNTVWQNWKAKEESDKVYNHFLIWHGLVVLKYQKVCDYWKAFKIFFNLRHSKIFLGYSGFWVFFRLSAKGGDFLLSPGAKRLYQIYLFDSSHIMWWGLLLFFAQVHEPNN